MCTVVLSELTFQFRSRTVHLCERIHNKQKVVVKRLRDLEGEQLEVAKNEISILKALNHPNVIMYFDSFVNKGNVSIVMEYASKGTLQELIAKERPNIFAPQVR